MVSLSSMRCTGSFLFILTYQWKLLLLIDISTSTVRRGYQLISAWDDTKAKGGFETTNSNLVNIRHTRPVGSHHHLFPSPCSFFSLFVLSLSLLREFISRGTLLHVSRYFAFDWRMVFSRAIYTDLDFLEGLRAFYKAPHFLLFLI